MSLWKLKCRIHERISIKFKTKSPKLREKIQVIFLLKFIEYFESLVWNM